VSDRFFISDADLHGLAGDLIGAAFSGSSLTV